MGTIHSENVKIGEQYRKYDIKNNYLKKSKSYKSDIDNLALFGDMNCIGENNMAQ